MMVSVVISSSGKTPILNRCLNSIKTQKSLAEIEIKISKYGNFPQRIKMLNEALGTIVIFLDEDTLLKDPEFIQRVMALVKKNPKMKIFGGLYEDHPEGLWSDRAYNFICNMWVLMAARPVSTEIFQTKQLLGGCIVVNKENLDLGGIFDPPFWGGEDTFFFRQARLKEFLYTFHPK